MQKRVLTRLFVTIITGCFMANAYAVSPGLYIGVMGGPSTNSASQQTVDVLNPPPSTTTAKAKTNQFAIRGYFGYKASQFFAVESGLTYFSIINFETPKGIDTQNLQAGVVSLDIMGVLTYSIYNTIEVFGKLGGAVIYEGVSRGLVTPAPGNSKYKTYARPTFSIGAGYDLNQSWIADLSYTRMMTGGIINNIDYIALGFSYHFVDRYCGQFLCDD